MIEFSELELRELAEWFKLIVKEPRWKRYETILKSNLDDRLNEIIGDCSENTHEHAWKCGFVSCLKQIIAKPQELINTHGTDHDTETHG